MKVVVQRVTRASVRVDGEVVGACGPGMMCLLGVMRGDGEAEVGRLADKLARFRMFPDDRDRMNVDALEWGAEALVVSQVTLAADGRKGRRPSLDRAAEPSVARALYESFAEALRERGLTVATGSFGARMEVELVNDGPVTFVLEELPQDPHAAPPGPGGGRTQVQA